MDIDPAATVEPTDKFERAIALIRSLEWAGKCPDGACCPDCAATKFRLRYEPRVSGRGMHKPNCRLAEFL